MWYLPRGYELVTISPSDHLLRSAFSILFITYFASLSLKFLRHLHSGVTLIYPPRTWLFTWPLSLRFAKGRVKSVPKGWRASYNSPLSSAVLGLLLFAAAQLLLVMMFKRVEYFF